MDKGSGKKTILSSGKLSYQIPGPSYIGGSISRLATWEPLIEKMRKKLATWKGKLLSIGGRLTLLKASISNLPIYFMSLYPMPQGVIDKITKIQRNFLWSRGMDKRSLALVKWELVQLPKKMGGLNVSNLLFRNLGLLCKWVWRYFSESSSLWSQSIKAKYKYQSSMNMADLAPIKSGGPWRHLCNHLLKHQETKEILKIGSRKVIGDGDSTFFWHDIWIGNSPLKDIFPRLFLISSLPMASVADMGHWDSTVLRWNLPWIRDFRLRDRLEWEQLHPSLSQASFHLGENDKMVWKLSKDGKFSVRSFYGELYKKAKPGIEFLSQKIWNGLVPIRIEVFTWLTVLERINTKKRLVALNIIPPSEVTCIMCNSCPEDASHLMLYCPFAMEIWSWWWELWNLSWVWPQSLDLALSQWSYPSRCKFFKKVWLAAFIVIIWSVWRERNERIFNKKSSSASEIKTLVLVRLCWWMKSWNCSFPYSVNEVLRYPRCLHWGNPLSHKKKISQPLPHPQPSVSSSMPCLKWTVGFSSFSPVPGTRYGGIYGGFLSNSSGSTLCSFSCPFPPMDQHAAAVISIHRALQISLSSQVIANHKILIFSDSISAVRWCQSSLEGPSNLSLILNFIRASCRKHPCLVIGHKLAAHLK